MAEMGLMTGLTLAGGLSSAFGGMVALNQRRPTFL